MSNVEEFDKYCLIQLSEGDEQINEEEADQKEENYSEEEIKEKEESEQKADKLEREDKDLLKKGKRKNSVPKKKKYDTFSIELKRKVIKDVI
jgi:hypothetical protein